MLILENVKEKIVPDHNQGIKSNWDSLFLFTNPWYSIQISGTPSTKYMVLKLLGYEEIA